MSTEGCVKFYVDPLMHRGMVFGGRRVCSSHLFTNGTKHDLLNFGWKIGLRSRWLDEKNDIIHFDVTEQMWNMAIAAGAIQVTSHEAAMIWKKLKEKAG